MTSYIFFPIFSRIERKLIKSFIQLKDLDIYSWPPIGEKNQPIGAQH